MARAQGVVLPSTRVADAVLANPHPSVLPAPQKILLENGVLPLAGLSLEPLGSAQELFWAARDLNRELELRGFAALPIGGTATKIRIGTLENSDLKAQADTLGLTPDRPEGYALWVDAKGANLLGFDALGAYRGAQTLRQLLGVGGFAFAKVADFPKIQKRVAMIYLDGASQGVNDILVPLLAKLKFSHLLVMCNYVRWDSSRNIWHPNGANKDEARRVAELIRTHGMKAIPLIETPGHAQWFFYNNQHRELVQDPESKDPYAYNTLDERVYQIILPILSEAVEVFKPEFVHIGHDEVAARDRFPARPDGIALGLEKLFVDHVLRLYTHLKSLGVGTMIWHDVAAGESFGAKIMPMLPKDIVVSYWNYSPAEDYPLIDAIQKQGFRTLGSSWFAQNSPESMAQAVARVGAFGAIQTRWSGYFGNATMLDGQAEQGIAYLHAGNAFWNPSAPTPTDAASRYRDARFPLKIAPVPGRLVNLSSVATRTLNDPDESGWIGRGPDIDLSSLPTGSAVRLGAYLFHISSSVMLRGARATVQNLPEKVVLELNSSAKSVVFLHTTGWLSPLTSPRTRVGSYTFVYSDGTSSVLPLEYGRNIAAWTEPLVRTTLFDPVWRGTTRDGLAVSLVASIWQNPKPELPIARIVFESAGLQSNPTLIGLTLLER
ncbi:MAG: glycoside hydrolase family 20 zincin-like fold domain-containing protein [Deinococcales bacterium]